MENHKFKINLKSKYDSFILWFIGDWHLGNRACDEKKLDRDTERIINTPDSYAFFMGDACEAIGIKDKRFDPMTIHPRYYEHFGDIFRQETKDAKRRLLILKPVLIGIHTGNHCLSLMRNFQYDLHKELVEDIGVKDLGWSAETEILVYNKGKHLSSLVVNSWHGVGEIKTMPAFMNRTKHFAGDIKVCGHNHQQEYKMVPRILPGSEEQIEDEMVVYIFSGSYLRTYESGMVGYGEQRGYEPVPLGCAKISIRLREDKKWEFNY